MSGRSRRGLFGLFGAHVAGSTKADEIIKIIGKFKIIKVLEWNNMMHVQRLIKLLRDCTATLAMFVTLARKDRLYWPICAAIIRRSALPAMMIRTAQIVRLPLIQAILTATLAVGDVRGKCQTWIGALLANQFDPRFPINMIHRLIKLVPTFGGTKQSVKLRSRPIERLVTLFTGASYSLALGAIGTKARTITRTAFIAPSAMVTITFVYLAHGKWIIQ